MPHPDTPDDLRIEIGAREIYDTLVDTSNAVKRLGEKFDTSVTTLGDRVADVEHRITALERWRYAAGGAAALAVVAIGWVIGLRGGL